LQELVFAPKNTETINMVIAYVTDALDRWEPRIELQSVNVLDDPQSDGALLVEINYIVSSTYNERSIVYPFYLSGEE